MNPKNVRLRLCRGPTVKRGHANGAGALVGRQSHSPPSKKPKEGIGQRSERVPPRCRKRDLSGEAETREGGASKFSLA